MLERMGVGGSDADWSDPLVMFLVNVLVQWRCVQQSEKTRSG